MSESEKPSQPQPLPSKTEPSPTPQKLATDRRTLRTVTLIIVVAVATFLVLLLLSNIAQRKQEAKQVVFNIVELDETTVDPAEWGKNFPRQYDSYKRTVDTERTTHGGSEAFQRLDRYPAWRTIFAGYAFSQDYREDRGHAYMLADQRDTERVEIVNQPGACLQCHASNVVAYREVGIAEGAPGKLTDPLLSENGQAQLFKGFDKVCGMDYWDATEKVEHPVSCLDCHDPQSMALRVTKPGFLRGIAELATSDYELPHFPSIERWRDQGKKGKYDPNELATRQEMRSMVCGQCHVEYYFAKPGNILTYPWAKGLTADQEQAYYDEIEFNDWTHKIAGTGMLKAQHPEFEMWSQGIHARSGVSCSDCHMPYKREGAIKVSDHWVRSPLLNINNACQTCHNYTEKELLARAENIQDKTRNLMAAAEDAVVDLINAIKDAVAAGRPASEIAEARALHRRSQWLLDWVHAENSMGFHADQEATRLLGQAIDAARKGQISLLKSKPEPAAAAAP